MRTPIPLAPILLVFLGFIIIPKALAQTTSCAQTIRLATSIYEQGRLHELPDLLDNCLKGGFTKQEKVTAYKLLTLSYIYLEEPEKADESMLSLLITNPYFEINEAVDPAEFIALYKTFRTTPIYRLGAKLGVNACQPNVIDQTTAVDITSKSKYSYGIGILFGGLAEVPINEKMTLHGELLYLQKQYSLNLMVDRGVDVSGESLVNNFTGTESQNWLSLPLNFEYRISKKKINPYVTAGFSTDYLLSDQLKGERTRGNAAAISQATFELKPFREKINLSLSSGIGLKIKIGGGLFITELRYIYGLTKINSSKTAFANEQATWEQGYADPVIKLTSLNLTTSYVYNIFNPKKKTSRK